MSRHDHKTEELQEQVSGREMVVLGAVGSAVPSVVAPGSSLRPARGCCQRCGSVVTRVPPMGNLELCSS